MPTLVLSRIGFEGRHGATAAERRASRRFEVDIEVDAALEAAQVSDRLADTIDYSEVADIIVSIGTGEPCRLLESLARRMLDALAERIPGAAFRIELRKLNPPSCAGHPAYSAVRMSRAPSGRPR
jgi:7,8-dihydroneopterin aldolase/epimerase/oxygenase